MDSTGASIPSFTNTTSASALNTSTLNTTSLQEHPGPHQPPRGAYVQLISNDFMFLFNFIVQVGINGIVNIFGIVANIINIAVFIRQGVFRDSATVTLTCLAVADGLLLLIGLGVLVSTSLAVLKPAGMIFGTYTLVFILGIPRVLIGQIARGITAYMALERCICVVFPFKVKSIFTPKCSLAAHVFICAFFVLPHISSWVRIAFIAFTNPATNQTIYVVKTSPPYRTIVYLLYYINQFGTGFFTVLVVLVCTLITTWRVRKSSDWRESNAATASAGTVKGGDKSATTEKDIDSKSAPESEKSGGDHLNSNKQSSSKQQKERKMIRTVTTISIIFLICYLPNVATTLAFSINPDISAEGKERNLALLLLYLLVLVESINSSINIFVYYNMGHRYKKEFHALFGRK